MNVVRLLTDITEALDELAAETDDADLSGALLELTRQMDPVIDYVEQRLDPQPMGNTNMAMTFTSSVRVTGV